MINCGRSYLCLYSLTSWTCCKSLDNRTTEPPNPWHDSCNFRLLVWWICILSFAYYHLYTIICYFFFSAALGLPWFPHIPFWSLKILFYCLMVSLVSWYALKFCIICLLAIYLPDLPCIPFTLGTPLGYKFIFLEKIPWLVKVFLKPIVVQSNLLQKLLPTPGIILYWSIICNVLSPSCSVQNIEVSSSLISMWQIFLFFYFSTLFDFSIWNVINLRAI